MDMLERVRIGMMSAAAALGVMVSNSAFAADASTEVATYSSQTDISGNLLKTIFEDDLWAFDPTGGITDFQSISVGSPVVSVGSIQSVGNGAAVPSLNPAAIIGGKTPVSGFAIEAVLSATVADTFIETFNGADRFGYLIMSNVVLDLYFGDNTNNSSISATDTIGDALDKFDGTDLDTKHVARFVSSTPNDFYVIKYDLQTSDDNGDPTPLLDAIVAFQLGLTEDLAFHDFSQLGHVLPTDLTSNVLGSSQLTQYLIGNGAPTVRTVSIFGAGGNEDPNAGPQTVGDFVILDGNFAAAIVYAPTPAAAGLGMMMMGALAFSRRQRTMA